MAPEVYPLVDLSLTILPQAYLAEDNKSVIAREPTNQQDCKSTQEPSYCFKTFIKYCLRGAWAELLFKNF